MEQYIHVHITHAKCVHRDHPPSHMQIALYLYGGWDRTLEEKKEKC